MTGLVDTYSTSTLLRLVAARQIDHSKFVTHQFRLDDMVGAQPRPSRGKDRRKGVSRQEP